MRALILCISIFVVGCSNTASYLPRELTSLCYYGHLYKEDNGCRCLVRIGDVDIEEWHYNEKLKLWRRK